MHRGRAGHRAGDRARLLIPPGGSRASDQVTPLVFVVVWATGFIVARLVAGHVEPWWFLAARFALTAACLAIFAASVGARWPATAELWGKGLLTGALTQGVSLGGVFWATHVGLPAAIASLITGLQPLATAVLAFPVLGERVSRRRWVGIVLGFGGAVAVVLPNLGRGDHAVSALPVMACTIAMLAITAGTLIQKTLPDTADLRTNACAQFIGGTAVTLPAALLFEPARFDGGWEVWAGLVWAVGALSLGATMLLLRLIRRGSVAAVASLFYLVPPVVALMAFALFDDRLTPVQLAGMAVAGTGVYVARQG